MAHFKILCLYFLFFHSDQLHHTAEWLVLSLKHMVRIECCERERWLQIAFKHIYMWVIVAAIMVDCYGELVHKKRWRCFVYWIFVKKLRPVKFCHILIIVLNLHKFKVVAFYNVCLNFILNLLLFLDFYPNLAVARSSAVCWGTTLQVGRLRVRFPMVSLEFCIDISLPPALWPWGWLSL
jgi:hypothetical protein